MEVVAGERIERIESARLSFEGLSVDYSLYAVALDGHCVHYAVGVRSKDECAFAVVGREIDRARNIYERICRAFVTPCTLEEVLSDIGLENLCGY